MHRCSTVIYSIILIYLRFTIQSITVSDFGNEIKWNLTEQNESNHFSRFKNQNVTFDCRVSAYFNNESKTVLKLKRAWLKNGVFLNSKQLNNNKKESIHINDKRYVFHSDSDNNEAVLMIIEDLSSQDAGTYSCSIWTTLKFFNQTSLFNKIITYELKVIDEVFDHSYNSDSSIILKPKVSDSQENTETLKNESYQEQFSYYENEMNTDEELAYDNDENENINDFDEEKALDSIDFPFDSTLKFVEVDDQRVHIKNVSDVKHLYRHIIVPSGHLVKFRCPIRGNLTDTSYRWYKDNKTLRGKYRKQGEEMMLDKWKLNLMNVYHDDSGNYTCFAKNSINKFNFTFILKVKYSLKHPPIFKDQSVSLNNTVNIGENVTLDCDYSSQSSSQFAWFQKLPNGTFLKLIKQKDKKLVFINVSEMDNGIYICLVSNRHGNVTRSFVLYAVSGKSATRDLMLFVGLAVMIGLCTMVTCVVLNLICTKRREAKKITVVAQRSFIIRKKIVLEIDTLPNNGTDSLDPKSTINLLSPFNVKIEKINYPTVNIQSADSVLSKCETDQCEYELPLDLAWELDRTKIILKEKLGEGEFGIVFKGELNDSTYKTEVAVKMLKEGHSDDEIVNLVSEMEVMKRIGKHKNIINLLGCCTQSGSLLVIVEYAPYGNLRDYLRTKREEMILFKQQRDAVNLTSHYVPEMFHRNQKLFLTFLDLINFAYQIARGMEYLASKRCVHRDLAARNVLVCNDNILKIADFGLARNIQGDYYRKTTNGRLPIKWMAIESLENQMYTTQSDVWSFGILLWEIMTLGRTPYPGINVQELWKRLETGYRMEKPVNCNVELYDIMMRCWAKQPSKRPGFSQIVKEVDILVSQYSNREYIDINFNAFESLSSSSEDEEIDTEDQETDKNCKLNFDNNKKSNESESDIVKNPIYKNLTFSNISIGKSDLGECFDQQHHGQWLNTINGRNVNHHYVNGIALRETLRQSQKNQPPQLKETSGDDFSFIENNNNDNTMHNKTRQTPNAITNKCYDFEMSLKNSPISVNTSFQKPQSLVDICDRKKFI